MTVFEAIMQRRTIRKFKQKKVERDELLKIADCGRMSAFAANIQPLKYAIINDEETVKRLYPFTKWAGYIPGWEPSENERPTAYIAVLTDTGIKNAQKSETDCGAAITSMMLCAYEMGLGSCWLGAIDRDGIKKLLNFEDKYYVSYLLAIGYPDQTGECFETADGSVKYYFDENGNVHVPKRTLEEVIIG